MLMDPDLNKETLRHAHEGVALQQLLGEQSDTTAIANGLDRHHGFGIFEVDRCGGPSVREFLGNLSNPGPARPRGRQPLP